MIGSNNTNTVGLEKIVSNVRLIKIKAPTIFVEIMNQVAVKGSWVQSMSLGQQVMVGLRQDS